MAQIAPHENLVSLIGVVTRGLPLMVLISYCEYGSLLDILRDCADGHGILLKKPKHPLVIAVDITAGMAHLAESFFIHRDLAARSGPARCLRARSDTCRAPHAANEMHTFPVNDIHALSDCRMALRTVNRNVLVDSAMVFKVADFGMSRGIVKPTETPHGTIDSNSSGSSYYRTTSGVGLLPATRQISPQTSR